MHRASATWPRPPSLAALAAAALAVARPPPAAHPLGNFTVNQYTRIEVARTACGCAYVLDLAEIPTFQERQPRRRRRRRAHRAGRDARVSATGSSARSCRRIWQLTADGRPVAARVDDRRAARSRGPGRAADDAAGPRFRAAGSRSAPRRDAIDFRTTTRPTASAGARCSSRAATASRCCSTDAATATARTALTRLPEDLLQSPPDVRSATTVARARLRRPRRAGDPGARRLAPATARASAKDDGGFASLIEASGERRCSARASRSGWRSCSAWSTR